MNLYTAKELAKDGQPTGLWHYTTTNDDHTRPVGYCADNCPGHPTADEARLHYRTYLLDTAFEETTVRWSDCKVCGAPTKRIITVGPGRMEFYPVCDAHADRRTTLDQLMPPVGDSWSSY